MTMVPLEAIDPEAASRRWADAFTYHLDLIPPIIDAIITTTLPTIHATQTDKARITGGGYTDNMTVFLTAFDQSDRVTGVTAGAAVTDAHTLWWWLTQLTTAVDQHTETPAPTLPDQPDADPLTARSQALTAIGWLIDHVHTVQDMGKDNELDDMYTLIRRLRARYGVHPTPRRPRLRDCTTCGEKRTVHVTWIDNPNGSPRPVRVARCRTCGETYTEENQ